MSSPLLAHDRQDGLGHGNGAKEVRFQLQPQFFQLDIFGEARHRESGVIDQHVDASVIAHYGVYNSSDVPGVRNVKRADIDLIGDSRGCCGLVELCTAAEIAHRGNHVVSRTRQFDRREEPKAARTSSDEGDLVSHRNNGLPHAIQDRESCRVIELSVLCGVLGDLRG